MEFQLICVQAVQAVQAVQQNNFLYIVHLVQQTFISQLVKTHVVSVFTHVPDSLIHTRNDIISPLPRVISQRILMGLDSCNVIRVN